MDILALAIISAGIFALSIVSLDWLFHRNSRVAKVQLIQRIFGNYLTTLILYELVVFLLLITCVIPLLWFESDPVFSYSYVIIMTVISPSFTYSLIRHRFHKGKSNDYLLGTTFEQTVELHHHSGTLDDFMSNFLKHRKGGLSHSVEQEFEVARERLLNRRDEVGEAFRRAIQESSNC